MGVRSATGGATSAQVGFAGGKSTVGSGIAVVATCGAEIRKEKKISTNTHNYPSVDPCEIVRRNTSIVMNSGIVLFRIARLPQRTRLLSHTHIH